MQTVAKVAAKGRITIPTSIRKALQVSRGDRTSWTLGADGTAVVRRLQPIVRQR